MEASKSVKSDVSINDVLIGKNVVVRTYAAGVHVGRLVKKEGPEVIIANSRRLWRWFAKGGISLSEIAVNGVVPEHSRICCPVPELWLVAIELIPASDEAVQRIMNAEITQPD